MTTYVFPGQGSQIKGMGIGLFNEFSQLTEQANAILGYSIKTLCLEDPHQHLNQTRYTQPALYVVNALTYFKKIQEKNKTPRFLAGHSLGEYNALLAASVFDFETGLKLVQKRGELMSQEREGAMAAIIGLKDNVIKKILEQQGLTNVTIANDNSHTQLVISGSKEDVREAQGLCEQAGAALVIPLKVSGAFHSPYMVSAQEEFERFLESFQFVAPSCPVISNYTARPYEAKKISTTLAQQITHPVRWTESISYILAQGETNFEEIGPGAVLSGLIRRIENGQ